MAWMGAPCVKRQIDWLNNLSRGGKQPTAIVLHITASSAVSQYGYFSGAGKNLAGSHFHVAADGTIEQYAGTGARSAADKDGNARTISIETQGLTAAGTWDAPQLEAIAQVVAWCAKTHGIPLKLMASSAATESGLGWHRLGIDGNFPALPSILAGRKQRSPVGELWSSASGKECPGDKRIQQIPSILARAIQINNGAAPKPPSLGTATITATLDVVDLRNADKQAVTGEDVDKLQGLLLAHRQGAAGLVGNNGRPDGSAGAATKNALIAFQKAKGLAADAVCGKDTWKALLETNN